MVRSCPYIIIIFGFVGLFRDFRFVTVFGLVNYLDIKVVNYKVVYLFKLYNVDAKFIFIQSNITML